MAITRADCEYPNVDIFGSGADVEQPMVVSRRDTVVIEGRATIDCKFRRSFY